MNAWVLLLTLLGADAQRAWPSHATAPPAPRIVAVVNGVELRSDRLDTAANALLPYESFHRNVSVEQVTAIRKKALTQVVDEELQYQEAVRGGITASAAEIDEALSKTVARYPSRKAFNDALTAAHTTVEEVRSELRRHILITKVYDQQVTSRCGADRADAQRYFSEHPEKFVEPERLHVFAITLRVDPSSGERGWATARARAEDVRKQLQAGAPFEDLARKYSTDPSSQKGGDMGLMHRGSLSQGFEKVAASLPLGQPSPVVETIYGYHIIRITEVLPSQPRSFAEIGARLQQDLSAERCTTADASFISGLRAAAKISYPQ
jgi:hypothetical protein